MEEFFSTVYMSGSTPLEFLKIEKKNFDPKNQIPFFDINHEHELDDMVSPKSSVEPVPFFDMLLVYVYTIFVQSLRLGSSELLGPSPDFLIFFY